MLRGCNIGLGAVNLKNQINIRLQMKTFTAIIQKEDDIYIAKCAEIRTVSQGHTIEEAVDNLKEATELYLEEFPLPFC